MILDMLVDLQTCIDVSAGRADCNVNVLILVGIEEVLNLVSGGTTLKKYLLFYDIWDKMG